MPQKILITGANGLLGQKLVALILNHPEYELIATARGENRNAAGKYVYEELDITSKEHIDQVLHRHQPDIIINTAAMTHVDQCELNPEQCQLLNVTAVQYLIEVSEQINAFFIHLSTDFIFDGTSGPYREEDEPNPLSVYAESKLASEELLLKSKLNFAIVRTMLVFGIVPDMSRSNIILWVKSSLEEGKKIRVVNDQWRTPTLAEDLAMGCFLIAKLQKQGVFHISGQELLTPYDMAIQTADFFGLDRELMEEVDGSIFTQPAKRPARTGFILDKAKTELGYRPRSFKDGLKILSEQLQHV